MQFETNSAEKKNARGGAPQNEYFLNFQHIPKFRRLFPHGSPQNTRSSPQNTRNCLELTARTRLFTDLREVFRRDVR